MRNYIIKNIVLGAVIAVAMLIVSACNGAGGSSGGGASNNTPTNTSLILGDIDNNTVYKGNTPLPGGVVVSPNFMGANSDGSVLYAAGNFYNSGYLYMYSNESWSPLYSANHSNSGSVTALLIYNNNVFVGIESVVYEVINGAIIIVNGQLSAPIISLISDSSNNLYVSNESGVYESVAGIWSQINAASTESLIESSYRITTLASNDNNIYIAATSPTAAVVFESTNGAWVPLTSEANSSLTNNIDSIVGYNSYIYVTTGGKIYKINNSVNSSFTSVNNGLPADTDVVSIATSGVSLYAISKSNVYSLSSGNKWIPLSQSFVNNITAGVVTSSGSIYVGNHNGYTYNLSDSNWVNLSPSSGIKNDPKFLIKGVTVNTAKPEIIYAFGTTGSNSESFAEYQWDDKEWSLKITESLPIIDSSTNHFTFISNLKADIYTIVVNSQSNNSIMGKAYELSST